MVVQRRRSVIPGFGITMGTSLLWLSLIVLLPLAALFLKTMELTFSQFVGIIASRRVLHAFQLSFGLSLAAAAVNLVFGTIVVWALVRYRFPRRRLFDAVVDIPFALPTATGRFIGVVDGMASLLPLAVVLVAVFGKPHLIETGGRWEAALLLIFITLVDLFGGYTFNIALSRRVMDVTPA